MKRPPMANARGKAQELIRLLSGARQPLYVLDARRQITFANQACAQWAGVPREELLGLACNYGQAEEESATAAMAHALCPPPEVFTGQRLTAAVCLPAADGTLSCRRAEFIPLLDDEGEIAAVLALASAEVLPDREACEADQPEPSAHALHARLAHWRQQLREHFHHDRLIGDSAAMRRVRAQVRLAAASTAGVLLVGAIGSGRQHVARGIHYGRRHQPAGAFVPLACDVLGAEMLQASIRGLARTAAAPAAAPAVAAQRPHTLLLNDVEALPAESQAELVGFMGMTELSFRVIATAREPLSRLVARGVLREDLALAISTLEIELPSLAARLEDVPLVAQMFLEEANGQAGKQLTGFAPEALDRMATYDWPGNLDELQAAVQESHARAAGPWVLPVDLPRRLQVVADAQARPRREPEIIDLEDYLAGLETEIIGRALALAKGNKTKAARLLGMTRPRLYRRLVQLGLETGEDDQ